MKINPKLACEILKTHIDNLPKLPFYVSDEPSQNSDTPPQPRYPLSSYLGDLCEPIRELSNQADRIFSEILYGIKDKVKAESAAQVKRYFEDYLDETYRIIRYASIILRQYRDQISPIRNPEHSLLITKACHARDNLRSAVETVEAYFDLIMSGSTPEISTVIPLTLQREGTTSLNLEAFYREQGTLNLHGYFSNQHLEILNFLNTHPEIHTLDLSEDFILDEDLDFFADAKFIRTLNLEGRDITPKGLSSLKRMPNLTNLDVSSTNCGNRGAKVLAEIVSLKGLNAAYTFITDSGVVALSRSSISALNLSHNKIRKNGAQALTTSHINTLFLSQTTWNEDDLMTIIQNPHLKTLDLSYCKFKKPKRLHDNASLDIPLPENVFLDDTFIEKFIEQNKTLVNLTLNGSNITNRGATLLATHPALRGLSLLSNRIDDEIVIALSHSALISLNIGSDFTSCSLRAQSIQKLVENPHLRHLKLVYVNLRGSLVDFKNSTLISLSLRHCTFPHTALKTLGQNPYLEKLSIDLQNLDDEIATAFANNDNILSLTLVIYEELLSAKEVCEFLKMPALKKLCLNLETTKENMLEIAKVISTHPTLRNLTLMGTNLTSAAAVLLSKNKNLRKLYIDGLRFLEKGAVALAAMPNCEILLGNESCEDEFDVEQYGIITQALGVKNPVARFNNAIKMNQRIKEINYDEDADTDIESDIDSDTEDDKDKDADKVEKQFITPAFPTLYRQSLFAVKTMAANNPSILEDLQLPEPILDALAESRF